MTEMKLDPQLMVELLRRGLNAGIPPTALSNMLGVEVDVVKNLSLTVRREKYGSAELSEVLSDLTWVAIDREYEIIRNGSPELSLKATQIYPGQSPGHLGAADSRRGPAGQRRTAGGGHQERIIDAEGEEIEPEASSFVAMDEPTDD